MKAAAVYATGARLPILRFAEIALTPPPRVAFYRQRFNQGGAVIKFRCLNCGQKIAVPDDGAGRDIACPTCQLALVIPPRSAPEFCSLNLPPMSLNDAGWEPSPEMRAALLPHLAQLMMDRLVEALVTQRRLLLATQQSGQQRLRDLEEHLAQVQARITQRNAAYEQRIAELERELAAKDAENLRLQREKARLVRPAVPVQPTTRSARVSLRSASVMNSV